MNIFNYLSFKLTYPQISNAQMNASGSSPVSKKFSPPNYKDFTEVGHNKVKYNEAQYELLKFFASQQQNESSPKKRNQDYYTI